MKTKTSKKLPQKRELKHYTVKVTKMYRIRASTSRLALKRVKAGFGKKQWTEENVRLVKETDGGK